MVEWLTEPRVIGSQHSAAESSAQLRLLNAIAFVFRGEEPISGLDNLVRIRSCYDEGMTDHQLTRVIFGAILSTLNNEALEI